MVSAPKLEKLKIAKVPANGESHPDVATDGRHTEELSEADIEVASTMRPRATSVAGQSQRKTTVMPRATSEGCRRASSASTLQPVRSEPTCRHTDANRSCALYTRGATRSRHDRRTRSHATRTVGRHTACGLYRTRARRSARFKDVWTCGFGSDRVLRLPKLTT